MIKKQSTRRGKGIAAAPNKAGRNTGGGLTPRQARFVKEYLVDLNATQAAIRAGYSEKTAQQAGSRLLLNVVVSAAVAKGQAAQFRKAEITAERVLREAGGLAFSSLQDLIDDDGNLLPIKDWPRDAAAAVSSVEITKRNLVAGDGAQEDVVKIRLWDKPANVQILMKHLGLLTEQINVTLVADRDRLLEAGRQRNADAAKHDREG